MPQLSISINGRTYQVACDDGEEEHLGAVAEYVDKHVTELAESVGNVGETRLLLMAALLIADELSESLNRIEALEAGTGEQKKGDAAGSSAAAQALTSAAQSLEDIAAELEAS